MAEGDLRFRKDRWVQRKPGMTSRANSSIERRTCSWGRPPKFIQQSTSPTPRRRSSSIFSATVKIDELRRLGVGEVLCWMRSEEHTSELQSRLHLVFRLLLG